MNSITGQGHYICDDKVFLHAYNLQKCKQNIQRIEHPGQLNTNHYGLISSLTCVDGNSIRKSEKDSGY